MNNECKHQWVKTLIGYQCQKCSETKLDKNVICTPGVFIEDSELEEEIKKSQEDEHQSE